MFQGILRNPFVWFAGLFIGICAWSVYFGLGWLPNKIRYWLLLPFATLIFQFLPGKKKQIRRNLALIHPEWTKKQIEKGAWENIQTLVKSWSTIFSIAKIDIEKMANQVGGEVDGLIKAFDGPEKVIVAFVHVGPVNELTSAVAALEIDAYVPVEAIPPLLFKLMAGSRTKHGFIEMEAVKPGKTLDRCKEKLRDGKVVILAADMPPSKKSKSYVLTVGAAETKVQLGLMRLALLEDAKIFLAYPHRDPFDDKPGVKIRSFQIIRTGKLEQDEIANSNRLLHEYEQYLEHMSTYWWRLSLAEMDVCVHDPQELGYKK